MVSDRGYDHTELRSLPNKGPTRFAFDGDGNVRIVSEAKVSPSRMRRVRRLCWEAMQTAEYRGRGSLRAYYRHPSLKNVPVRVLREVAREMEAD